MHWAARALGDHRPGPAQILWRPGGTRQEIKVKCRRSGISRKGAGAATGPCVGGRGSVAGHVEIPSGGRPSAKRTRPLYITQDKAEVKSSGVERTRWWGRNAKRPPANVRCWRRQIRLGSENWKEIRRKRPNDV